MTLEEFEQLKADIGEVIEDPCIVCGGKSDYGSISISGEEVVIKLLCKTHYLEDKYANRKNNRRNKQKRKR